MTTPRNSARGAANIRTPKARGISLKPNIGETVIPGNPAATLPIAVITIDDTIQQRASMDAELVLEYQANIGEWIAQAPVIVYGTEGVYWLADGFHRLAAASGAGLAEIPAIIHPGTRRDALLYAIGANATHGKPRTNADKRRAVETLLSDAEWSGRSDRWIAETAKVSPPLIAKVRAESTVNIYSSSPDADQLQISAREQVEVELLPLVDYAKRNPAEMHSAPEPTVPAVKVSAEPAPDEGATGLPPLSEHGVEIAEMMGVSEDDLRQARFVKSRCTEDEWEAIRNGDAEMIVPLAPTTQKRIGRDGKSRSVSAPVELTPAQKAATTRAHNRGWDRKKYEIERQLRIGADKYGREQMIVFLKDRLAAMEKEVSQ